MPIVLRIILIISSFVMLIYMIRKVKKSKMQIEYTVFWIVFGLLLLFISFVPQVVYFAAKIIGIQSPANLVLSFVICVLVIKQFMMTIEISQLETKLKELVEEIAIKDKEDCKDSID